jgi:hypothetical protein
VILVAVAIGAGIGIGITVAEDSDSPSAKAAPADPGTFWAAGAHKAPDFTLQDQSGRRSACLAAGPAGRDHLHRPGLPQPLPARARVMNDASRRLPAGSKPTIVARQRQSLEPVARDPPRGRRKWNSSAVALGTRRYKALARIWRQYAIGVQVRTRQLSGVQRCTSVTRGAPSSTATAGSARSSSGRTAPEDLAAAVQRADSLAATER